jgi:photosystem II stability/assembly factor-like uncharacterized protein
VAGLPEGAEPTALAVGPSVADGPGSVFAPLAEGGLLRSADGGATWATVEGIDAPVAAVALAPDGRRVWAPDHEGVLHASADGGAAWTSSSVPGVDHLTSALVVEGDGGEPRALLGTGDGRVVTATVDGEVEVVGEGLPPEPVVGLAAAGGREGALYASTATSGVHRSDDGGRTWTASSDGLTTSDQRDEPEYADRPDFGPLAVAADPAREGGAVLFAGGFDGLFRSTDGGRHWRETETIAATVVVGLAVSPAFAEDRTMLVTTYLNGAHRSEDGGETWTSVSEGLVEPGLYDDGPDRFARLFGVAFAPGDGRTAYATRPRTLLRSTDGGRTWTALEVPGTDPSDGALHYVLQAPTPELVYLADIDRGRVYRSDDGGATLRQVGDTGIPTPSMVVHPDDPMTLYAGTREGLRVSTDGGATWTTPGPGPVRPVTTLAVGVGADGPVVFAGSRAGLWVSDDGGASHREVRLGAPLAPIEGVVVSPAYPTDGTVLVSVMGHGLFRSTDGGRTFAPAAPAMGPDQHVPTSYSRAAAPPIAFSPTFAQDRTVVASVGSEVLRSSDGGDTWTAVSIEAATHPPVERPAPGWGRRRKAAAGAAVVGVLALGVVGVALVGRRRRRAARDVDQDDPASVPG